MKITFLGAGSTIFAKNVLGDVLLSSTLKNDLTIALYDISEERLNESYVVIDKLNKKYNDGAAIIEKYLGVEKRKDKNSGKGACHPLSLPEAEDKNTVRNVKRSAV